MIIRGFFLVGIAFLAISLWSLFVLIFLLPLPGHPSIIRPLTQPIVCQGGCGDFLPATISDSNPYNFIVEGNQPKQMDIGTSENVALALTAKRFPISAEENIIPAPTPTSDTKNRVVSSFERLQTLDVDYYEYCQKALHNHIKEIHNNNDKEGFLTYCKYDAPITDIFGPGYQVFASAHLNTTSFDVQLLGSEEQLANQPIINWNWNIYPKSVGIQILSADIELQWKPINKSGEEILRQFWQYPITIEVDKAIFEVGQFTISAIVTSVCGIFFTGVSLPWIWEKRQTRKKENKKNNDKKASSTNDYDNRKSMNNTFPYHIYDKKARKNKRLKLINERIRHKN